MNTLHRRLAAAFGLALTIALAGQGALAQAPAVPTAREPQAAPAPAREGREGQAREGQAHENQGARPDSRPDRSASAQRLPADATSEHTVELPGRTLRFKVIAGALPINDGEGALQAEIAYTAYSVGPDNAAARPVTFVFNGGPGASSAYLQLGALGPWRLPLDNITPASEPDLVANADTWLDFTDLVFIDPVGTGYSHFVVTSEPVRKQFWSVDGDAASLAVFIRKWIEKYGRQSSLKFIVGESYGGFRAPLVATKLQSEEGVGVAGLVMISPVLDFAWRGQKAHSPLLWVSRLPSMAAATRETKQPFDREALREVERYAAGDFLLDLLRGVRDTAAVDRVSTRVAAFTGLDPVLVRQLAGRVDLPTFQRELNRSRGLVTSIYDTTVTALDPYPTSRNSRFSDPFLSAMTAPLTSAATGLYRTTLGWKVDAPYHLLDSHINSQWDFGRSRGGGPDVVDDLRTLLTGDRHMQILIAHGAADLVTPYFENQLIVDQMPSFGAAERLKLVVHGGGHMFYSRDGSRRALRTDAQRLYATRRESAE